jgi:hypothetical protein
VQCNLQADLSGPDPARAIADLRSSLLAHTASDARAHGTNGCLPKLFPTADAVWMPEHAQRMPTVTNVEALSSRTGDTEETKCRTFSKGSPCQHLPFIDTQSVLATPPSQRPRSACFLAHSPWLSPMAGSKNSVSPQIVSSMPSAHCIAPSKLEAEQLRHAALDHNSAAPQSLPASRNDGCAVVKGGCTAVKTAHTSHPQTPHPVRSSETAKQPLVVKSVYESTLHATAHCGIIDMPKPCDRSHSQRALVCLDGVRDDFVTQGPEASRSALDGSHQPQPAGVKLSLQGWPLHDQTLGCLSHGQGCPQQAEHRQSPARCICDGQEERNRPDCYSTEGHDARVPTCLSHFCHDNQLGPKHLIASTLTEKMAAARPDKLGQMNDDVTQLDDRPRIEDDIIMTPTRKSADNFGGCAGAESARLGAASVRKVSLQIAPTRKRHKRWQKRQKQVCLSVLGNDRMRALMRE